MLFTKYVKVKEKRISRRFYK